MLRFNRISSRLLLLLAASTARLLERTVKADLQLQELLKKYTELPFSSPPGAFSVPRVGLPPLVPDHYRISGLAHSQILAS